MSTRTGRTKSLGAWLVLARTVASGTPVCTAAERPQPPANRRPRSRPAQPASNPFEHVQSSASTLEGYYQYNWNRPTDRVNLLRAYDTRANVFSIQQAALVVESAPDVEAGRRFGARVDLQFGQATETVQGGAANEPRPDVYRHIWQAYGTYVFPVGTRPADRLRQVRVEPRLRDQLREGQQQLLARVPVQLPAVLSLRACG